MARPKGFEPLTPRFVVWCSIQLSYGRAVWGVLYGGRRGSATPVVIILLQFFAVFRRLPISLGFEAMFRQRRMDGLPMPPLAGHYVVLIR